MTAKQILDSFSETVIQDERILSGQERSLLTALLRHAATRSGNSVEIRVAVGDVIASAIGETIAQRAFAVLGSSIVERILESSKSSVADPAILGTPSTPVAPGGPHAEPEEEPLKPEDVPPVSDSPGGPHATATHVAEGRRRVSVLERAKVSVANSVVLDEFLAPQVLQELTRFALEHEIDFLTSEVVAPKSEGGIVNYEHRRSRVLMDLGEFRNVMLNRIQSVLPQVLQRLEMPDFPIAGIDVQMTASNDGDFFCRHSDNGQEKIAARQLTYVYFFHREPCQFQGGELRIHDSVSEGRRQISTGNYQRIVPQQNQIVFFPCSLLHEITPVACPSQLFADSRFTVNGWLRQ